MPSSMEKASEGGFERRFWSGNDTLFPLITSDRGMLFERSKVMFYFVHKPNKIAVLVPAWLPPVYVCFCEVMDLVFLLCFLVSVVLW